ncbi:hypothetical protein JOF49_001525 [Corynebacterium suicordis]|nr:hypothetical protein [Corynebacterium suicordis]
MTHRNPHDPSNGDLGNGEGGQNNADLTAANEHNRATRELAEKRAAEIRAKARERAAQAQKAAEPAPVPRVSEEAAHEDTARADTAREEPRAQRVTAQPVPKQTPLVKSHELSASLHSQFRSRQRPRSLLPKSPPRRAILTFSRKRRSSAKTAAPARAIPSFLQRPRLTPARQPGSATCSLIQPRSPAR